MNSSQFTAEELEIQKELNRYMWGSGNYSAVSELVKEDASRLLQDAEVSRGHRVLDVATGNGNVAVAAAQRGATVTGLDLTPELLALARARAAATNLSIDWVEGDAEALPFPDDAFDRVFSTFGTQFAPRHRAVALELYRVCRPGGLVGLCNWTPSGWTGQFTEITSGYFPPPPDFVQPAMNWGLESYVRELFEPLGGVVQTEERSATYEFPTIDEFMAFFQSNFGPWVVAGQAIGSPKLWKMLIDDLRMMSERFNEGEGTFLVRPTYLRVLVSKPVD